MSSDFNIFWEHYGKKRERSDAERAWQRLDDAEQQAAIKGIVAYHKRCRQEGKETSYPAAYLNQHLWQTRRGRRPSTAKANVQAGPAKGFTDPETW